MKKHNLTIIFILIFLIGLSLLLYPTVSDYINSKHQTELITSYTQSVAEIPPPDYSEYLTAANEYNEALRASQSRFHMTDEQRSQYNALLNPLSNNVMGYLQIDSIDVQLPIYHGTGESALQSGIGHLEGSSLPVGGLGTHAVLSGHRGLPSAKLLSELDQVEPGDSFLVTVLDQTLAYQVDQILIVEPHDIAALDIDPQQDYCTLVTCTPYGVNSHRMLVRGRRVNYEAAEGATALNVRADASLISSVRLIPYIAVPILLVLLPVLLAGKPRRRRG